MKNNTLYYKKYFPKNNAKAVIQISHGMVEHSGRYKEFIDFLVNNDYAVYINDHKGFGENSINGNIGCFDKLKSWEMLVDDMHQLNKIIGKENPSKKIIMIGHSMGSMLARNYIQKYKGIAGLILSGSNGKPGFNEIIALLIAFFETVFFGINHKSKVLYYIQFGSYNMSIENKRTLFEWLSRDRERVDDYVLDPYCGVPVSSAFFIDMLLAYFKISKKENISKIDKELPLFFISGENDPVGNFSKGVNQTIAMYKNEGIKNISLKLYPNARHEVLNEINRNEVFNDIIIWIENNILKKQMEA